MQSASATEKKEITPNVTTSDSQIDEIINKLIAARS